MGFGNQQIATKQSFACERFASNYGFHPISRHVSGSCYVPTCPVSVQRILILRIPNLKTSPKHDLDRFGMKWFDTRLLMRRNFGDWGYCNTSETYSNTEDWWYPVDTCGCGVELVFAAFQGLGKKERLKTWPSPKRTAKAKAPENGPKPQKERIVTQSIIFHGWGLSFRLWSLCKQYNFFRETWSSKKLPCQTPLGTPQTFDGKHIGETALKVQNPMGLPILRTRLVSL